MMDPLVLWTLAGILVAIIVAIAVLIRRRSRVADDTVSEHAAPETVQPDSVDETVVHSDIDGAPDFRRGLERSRGSLLTSLTRIFGRDSFDETWDELEEALIAADVGVVAATEMVEELRGQLPSNASAEQVRTALAAQLRALLDAGDRSLSYADGGLTVWLVTGVNGTGKTTTIGKLAAQASGAGRRVVLAAADTFRAAAAEQLQVWAQRANAIVVRKPEGADPASVAFEAYDAARGQQADLLIVDTAGRLHNKRELMDELGKVKRVLEKQAGTIDETLLVLDATTGQNGIAQAKAFLEAVEVTGIALTKLDGSSKGGIVVAVQRELGIPVKLVGLGESIGDLAAFDSDRFVTGLLD